MENTRRRTVVNSSVSHPALQCHYKDILEKNIPLDYVSKVFISVADLDCDMSLLKQLMNQKPLPCIIFLDFESARYVDRILEDVFPEKCFLENDGQRISREYIDLSKLKHIQLSIPLDYLVWGVQFHDKVDTYCFKYNDFSSYVFRNGNGSLSKEDLQKIRQAIHQLSHYHTKDAVDKLCLISDYIQSRTQFIHGRESIGGGRCFITPDFPEHAPGSGLVETILNHQYGVCMGIANLSTLLLNNPDFDVEVESVESSHHVWNKILVDGKYYYFDNTWNITRSDTPSEDGLITLSFSKKFLLFGDETAQKIGDHVRESEFIYHNGDLSFKDYPKKIDYDSIFSYQEKPKYYSYLKK